MHFLFDNNGETSIVRDSRDMLKALGVGGDAPAIIMTDESGALVGAGRGPEALNRSVPLIKALRDSKPIGKPAVKNPVLFTKSLRSRGATGFDSLMSELAAVRRSLA